MHTAKAPPMEIAEDVRRVMRSRMFLRNERGDPSITFRNSCHGRNPSSRGSFRIQERERERKLRFLFFPLFDSWNNFLNWWILFFFRPCSSNSNNFFCKWRME